MKIRLCNRILPWPFFLVISYFKHYACFFRSIITKTVSTIFGEVVTCDVRDIYNRYVMESVQVSASTETSPDYMTPVNAIRLLWWFDLKCGNNKNLYLQMYWQFIREVFERFFFVICSRMVLLRIELTWRNTWHCEYQNVCFVRTFCGAMQNLDFVWP